MSETAHDRLMQDLGGLGRSLRRHYIDSFFLRHVPSLPKGARVLDLGGTKTNKRGHFDIGGFDLDVRYANARTDKSPDVQCDALELPFCDGAFDAVICAELLEHVRDPATVLRECRRVLKADGVILISAPFMFRIHADPDDYGRYTESYWREKLGELDFMDVQIEKHGLMWSVLMEMMRGHFQHRLMDGNLKGALKRRLLFRFLRWAIRKAVERDSRAEAQYNSYCSSFTTGYGVRAVKAAPEDNP